MVARRRGSWAARLRAQPYNPNARDADGDGIVQEWTPWERPLGTRWVDSSGSDVSFNKPTTSRPPGIKLVDRNGRDVDYTPLYQQPGAVGPDGQRVGGPEKSKLGATLGETMPPIGERLQPLSNLLTPFGERNQPEPSAPEPPAPKPIPEPEPPRPPRRPYKPVPPPLTGRAQEIADEIDREWEAFRDRLRREGFVVFDYETTGFDAGNKPVQVGAVRVKNGEIVERVNIYMNPGTPLGEWAKENLKDEFGNPLTDEYLASQISRSEAHAMLAEFLGDSIIAAHNLPFDEEILRKELEEAELPYLPSGSIDTLELMRHIVPSGKDGGDGPSSHGLGPLAEHLGVELRAWHTADADAEAAALVFNRGLDYAVDRNVGNNGLSSEFQERRYRDAQEQFKKDSETYERNLEKYKKEITDYENRRQKEGEGAPAEPLETTAEKTTRQFRQSWETAEDIVNLEALGYDPDDEGEEFEDKEDFLREYLNELLTGGDWAQWDPCREIRKRAYEVLGLDESPADANLNRAGGFFGNGHFIDVPDDQRTAQAMLLLARIAEMQRENNGPDARRTTLFRAMTTNGDVDSLLETMKPGETVDIPLISTAEKADIGGEHYLQKYGDEVLLEIDTTSSIEGDIIAILYDRKDQDRTLQMIEETIIDGNNQRIAEIEGELEQLDADDSSRLELQEEIETLTNQNSELDALLKEIENPSTGRENRERAIGSVEDEYGDYFGEPFRWAGTEIPEEDSEYYYDYLSYGGDGAPREHVTGGRFEVISVAEDDSDAPYSHRITLRQIGAYDPANPSQLVGEEQKLTDRTDKTIKLVPRPANANLPGRPDASLPEEMFREANPETLALLADSASIDQTVPRVIAAAFYQNDFTWIVEQFMQGTIDDIYDPRPVEVTLAEVRQFAENGRESAQSSARSLDTDNDGFITVWRAGDVEGRGEPVSVTTAGAATAADWGAPYEYRIPIDAVEFEPEDQRVTGELLVDPSKMQKIEPAGLPDDVTDFLDIEDPVEAAPEQIAGKYGIVLSDRYTASGGEKFGMLPDGRYVILEDQGDGTIMPEVYDNFYQISERIDTEDLEKSIRDDWWREIRGGRLYHGTSAENLESIRQEGLNPENRTRGLGNRGVGLSVFATSSEETAAGYASFDGAVVEIDVERAVADGVIEQVSVSREPGYDRADALASVAYEFDDYDFDPYSEFSGTGENPDTFIFGSNIPPQYLLVDGEPLAEPVEAEPELRPDLLERRERMRARRERRRAALLGEVIEGDEPTAAPQTQKRKPRIQRLAKSIWKQYRVKDPDARLTELSEFADPDQPIGTPARFGQNPDQPITNTTDAVRHLLAGGTMNNIPNELWRDVLEDPSITSTEEQDTTTLFKTIRPDTGASGDVRLYFLRAPDGTPTNEGFIIKGLQEADEAALEIVGNNTLEALGFTTTGAAFDGEGELQAGVGEGENGKYMIIPIAYQHLNIEKLSDLQRPENGAHYAPAFLKDTEHEGNIPMIASLIGSFLIGADDRNPANTIMYRDGDQAFVTPIDVGWIFRYAPDMGDNTGLQGAIDAGIEPRSLHEYATQMYTVDTKLIARAQTYYQKLQKENREKAEQYRQQIIETVNDLIEKSEQIANQDTDTYIENILNGIDTNQWTRQELQRTRALLTQRHQDFRTNIEYIQQQKRRQWIIDALTNGTLTIGDWYDGQPQNPEYEKDKNTIPFKPEIPPPPNQ